MDVIMVNKIERKTHNTTKKTRKSPKITLFVEAKRRKLTFTVVEREEEELS